MKLYTGVVENRQDPFKLGRCQVRVVGLHNHDKSILKTADLPWAYPIQPITSAAMSGIGQSPLGLVEGTWVLVMFRDTDEQQPIIIGSLAGIPQQDGPIDQSSTEMILKEDGYLPGTDEESLVSKSGDIIKNSSGSPAEESTGLATASSFTTSSETANELTGSSVSYQDVKLAAAESKVKSQVKSDITQSMFDSLVSLEYNKTGALDSSSIVSDLNNNDYLAAATGFAEEAKVNGEIDQGELRKRLAEKDKFIAEGIPGPTGDLVPVKAAIPTVDSSTTASGQLDNGLKMVLGFRDPNGKYPLYRFEPDTNKLARHEDIKKTIVRKKELTRTKGVVTAFNVTWDQSPIPYNATYPYNHVYQSESGHVLEFDDTKHSERIHLYHTKGTFFEIDSNGTKVEKIVGDNYEILERNDHLYVKGSGHITIDGNWNVKVNNNANIEVMGNASTHVHGDMETSVLGSYKVKATSINLEAIDTFDISSPELNETAQTLNLNAGLYNQESNTTHYRHNGDKYTYHGGDTYLVAASGQTDYSCPTNRNGAEACPSINSASEAETSGLTTPLAYDPVMPTFKELQVITRGVEAAAHYETPEEGDPTAYIAKRINEGTLDPDDEDYGTTQKTCAVTRNSVTALPQSCTIINGIEKFTPDLYLSKHFTLSALTKNGSRMPKPQQGLTENEIVCNLKGLCENVLEPLAELYPNMVITSGFRRPGDVRGSSATSQHYLGQAADIVIPGFSREQHYEAACQLAKMVPYDQILLEYSGKTTVWIHVSFKYTANRFNAFTMRDHKRASSNGQFVLIT
jgi:GH24 family phage-related lysozyme (muramidase)